MKKKLILIAELLFENKTTEYLIAIRGHKNLYPSASLLIREMFIQSKTVMHSKNTKSFFALILAETL